jgi:hypothetical protein
MIFPGLVKNFAPVQRVNFDPVTLAFQAGVGEYLVDGLMELLDVVPRVARFSQRNRGEKKR